jgi:hypothetical protein
MMQKFAIFIFILGCFVFVNPTVLLGESILIDLDVRIAQDLKISKEDVKKDLISGMERGFSKKGIMVVPEEKRSDFKLTGTVFVKPFINSPSSYSIIFKAKQFKIVSSLYWRVVPALVFDPFTSRDRSGGVTSREDLDDAVDESMQDLLFMMDKIGMFDFYIHTAFGKVIDEETQNPGNFKKILNRERFEQLVDRVVERLSIAINVTVNAHISGPSQPQSVDIVNELKRIRNEINGLKSDNRSIDQKLQTLNNSIHRANYLKTGSIIINVKAGSLNVPRFFPARIIPSGGCRDCVEPHIDAVNLGALVTKNDFKKFAQEARYRIPYWMNGELSKRYNRLVVTLSKKDYRKIFDIDKNCQLPGNVILNSVKKHNQHPRILIRFVR